MLTNNLYNIHTYDGLVSVDARRMIWEHLKNQTWHVHWHKISEIPGSLSDPVKANSVEDLMLAGPTKDVLLAQCLIE